PGLLLAQALGRWGNYFNQELFGGPTTLPWGLQIDPASPNFPTAYVADTLFHPTFLYESLWDVAGVALLLLLDRRFHFRRGRLFWLYAMYYTLGRVWIEMLRIDDAEQITVFGVTARLNVWTSVLVFLASLVAFLLLTFIRRGRADESVLLRDSAAGGNADMDEDVADDASGDARVPAGVSADASYDASYDGGVPDGGGRYLGEVPDGGGRDVTAPDGQLRPRRRGSRGAVVGDYGDGSAVAGDYGDGSARAVQNTDEAAKSVSDAG
ncbi:MAG TPA: prolipoprotein diacylglyceryl transferase, partial [Micrococcaceae bacterium]